MAIDITNLSCAYSRIAVIEDVSVRADSGRLVAVLGPNASGKSTLLRCIIGALRPRAGSVTLNGEVVHRLSPRVLASRIAYVPQRAIVSAAFTVRQIVALGRYALPQDFGRVDRAIERCDLWSVRDRPYRSLSVGQQQRVTLARALAQVSRCGMLVLDEPTSAMDLAHAALAWQIVRDLAKDQTLVLAAMHDMGTAAAIADDVWLLDGGRLVASGPACDVLQPQQLEDVFKVGFGWIKDHRGHGRLLADAPAFHRH